MDTPTRLLQRSSHCCHALASCSFEARRLLTAAAGRRLLTGVVDATVSHPRPAQVNSYQLPRIKQHSLAVLACFLMISLLARYAPRKHDLPRWLPSCYRVLQPAQSSPVGAGPAKIHPSMGSPEAR